jgi:hypothetical protein
MNHWEKITKLTTLQEQYEEIKFSIIQIIVLKIKLEAKLEKISRKIRKLDTEVNGFEERP